MKLDYIVVGLGLAGLSFIEELEKHNKSFIVFEDNSQNSSKVAGGMFNPVILKRFTPVWNGKEQLDIALPFFKQLENKFKNTYIFNIDIYRIFKSVEEQNNWFAACDKPILSHFMTTPIIHNNNSEILTNFGLGKLKNTGRLLVSQLLKDYSKYLSENNKLIKKSFYYNDLKVFDNYVIYKEIESKNIVFCEGYGLKKNPFFNYLPLNEAKGELITIHAPKLKMDFLLKSAVFVLPLGNDLYKVGATFNWKDKTQTPTKEGKNELITKLNTSIKTPYKIVGHSAGIRPTVKDRRPLVGLHSIHKNMAILNGLGTRGVMLAPTMAKKLFAHIEYNKPLSNEIDIKRFKL